MQENIWLQPFSIPSTFTNNCNYNWLKRRSQRETLTLLSSAHHDEEVKSQHLLSHMHIPLFWVKIKPYCYIWVRKVLVIVYFESSGILVLPLLQDDTGNLLKSVSALMNPPETELIMGAQPYVCFQWASQQFKSAWTQHTYSYITQD